MKILSLWSGPRNVSTALMYSFAQRPDTKVVDEPLYAHYLFRTNANHPGEQEVLNNMENDGTKVLNQLQKLRTDHSIVFLKNMGHHWIDLDERLLDNMEHVFLIRDPKEMLPSLINQLKDPVLRDTGLKVQKDLYDILTKRGKSAPVIDAKLLLTDPQNVLQKACNALNIPFYPEMLKWEKGPRTEDGVWAKYWYHRVHQSEGFTPYEDKKEPFPKHLEPLLEECEPYYKFLYQKAIKI
ncbi:sulfotransferase family protein [Fulvivirga ulvae]|uniref:sulfotransferase-like domain-containing protein n=1 Tax=Fulvivirga ulvae TaxID=2904245 RepID=UPI001F455A4A|nr:sulfotransferase family protein [Fulvivirga ulvae]UII33874.1 sulfotransferase family protein [Fulvivirga ulvae]